MRPDDGLLLPDLVRLPLRGDGTCEVERLPFAHEVMLHVPGHDVAGIDEAGNEGGPGEIGEIGGKGGPPALFMG